MTRSQARRIEETINATSVGARAQHGFDEFFGNLYHLNTEEEPELAEWPRDVAFDRRYRPRGVVNVVATDFDDPTEDARLGRVGRQRIKDSGPLTRTRMETIDEELGARAKDFITRAVQAGQPFFVWHNPSRMHIYTRLKPASANLATPYSASMDVYGSGLMEHDGHVGELLRLLDELKVADNTIVVWTDARDHDAEEHLAPLQNARKADRLPGAQASRPAPRRRRRSARAATRPGRRARAPRPRAHRHHSDLHEDSPAAAQARGGVLRGRSRAC